MTRGLLWIGVAVAVLAAAWLVLTLVPFSSDVRFEAETPRVIGNSEDAFAYAGEGVHTIEGTATLRIDPDTLDGILEFDLSPDEALTALLDDEIPERSIMLRLRLAGADAVWTDRTIHGDSAIGDSRLPETTILYAGSGRFELRIDGVRQPPGWQGFWSIGNALRQPDGSIRDQGLVFSPLLRDQSGFSDPDRTELTLLIYDSPVSDAVVLHLVFPDALVIEP
ncbi:hypothetical protein ACFLS0_05750 [Candidatus Bipolaricaulota bacterium]